MPVDSSIYQNYQGLNILGNVQQGMNLRDQMDQRNQRQEQMNREKAIRDAYNAGITKNYDGTVSYDQNKTLGALAGVGGQEYLQEKQRMVAQDQASQKANLEKKIKEVEAMGQLAGSAVDQATYSNAITQAKSMGIDVSQMPQSYDPTFVKSIQARAMTAKDQLESQFKQQDSQYKGQEVGIKRDELNLKRAEFENKRRDPQAKLTEGEKAVDRKYAENFNNLTGKGYNNAATSIASLEKLATELEKDNGTFQSGGGRASFLPDALRSRDSIRYRDTAVNAANATLKEIFGSQLSDGERMAAAKEFYNDGLDNKENAKILRGKIELMKQNLETEAAKARHFEANRTLSGYKPMTQKRELEQSPTSSRLDNEAVSWARQNSNDPRAAAILRANGYGG